MDGGGTRKEGHGQAETPGESHPRPTQTATHLHLPGKQNVSFKQEVRSFIMIFLSTTFDRIFH